MSKTHTGPQETKSNFPKPAISLHHLKIMTYSKSNDRKRLPKTNTFSSRNENLRSKRDVEKNDIFEISIPNQNDIGKKTSSEYHRSFHKKPFEKYSIVCLFKKQICTFVMHYDHQIFIFTLGLSKNNLGSLLLRTHTQISLVPYICRNYYPPKRQSLFQKDINKYR